MQPNNHDRETAGMPERLAFEEPRLISKEAWSLENITANIGGFFSGTGAFKADHGHHLSGRPRTH
jgi:hypothetical protein